MTETHYAAPPEFNTYWDRVLEELDGIQARPELEPIPIRETEFAELYGVRLTGAGPYRLFGYLSVPKAPGSYPAIYWPPKYASVLEVIPQGTAVDVRRHFVTFSCAGRGQRNADRPFAAMFPGLLTKGIASPESYVFRGIVADAIRGLEFLRSRPEVDTSRVVAIGNDVALQAVALRGDTSHLVCTPALFFDPLDQASRTDGYPLEEYNDFLRLNPVARDSVANSLGYFDIRGFAPSVECSTLLMAGPAGSNMGPEALADLSRMIAGDVEIHASQRSSYRDGMHMEEWIAEQLGLDGPILPEHWR